MSKSSSIAGQPAAVAVASEELNLINHLPLRVAIFAHECHTTDAVTWRPKVTKQTMDEYDVFMNENIHQNLEILDVDVDNSTIPLSNGNFTVKCVITVRYRGIPVGK